MAHRFCFPDWTGADGASVTKWAPVNGVDGAMWPENGTVYKTLAATYATGTNTIWLPYGYRLTPPANGQWIGTANQVESGTTLTIRAYDAGLGARDPYAEAAARARIRRAAYWFDEDEFRAGAQDCWSAMKWPVIDMGYYFTAGEWAHISAGSGGQVWRTITAWKPGTSGVPGIYLMLAGAQAPSNKTADLVFGTVRQQAYTQAQMKLEPSYTVEGEGVWHSYRSNADGTANASGTHTTILMVTPSSDAAGNPATYYGGLCAVWHTVEDVILVRNGGALDVEDLCVAHVRRGFTSGDYTNTTANGVVSLERTHVVVPWKRAYHVSYNGDAVSHCGTVSMRDISWDLRVHDEVTHNAGTSDEPRSWGSCEGLSLEFRAVGVQVEGGWGIGGQHNACAVQGAGSTTDAREPNGCSIRSISVMGGAGAQDRLWSIGGWGNTLDGVYAFGGTTRSQFTVNGDVAGRRNELKNIRMGAYRSNVVAPDETWTLAQFTTSGSPTPPGSNGKVGVINCLFDTSNGANRFGVGLVGSNADELVGANAIEMEGVTLRVAPAQECAIRVVHRADTTTQIDRSQVFKHLRIVQESGAAIPQVGYQQNKSSSSDTGMTFSTLASHFNGAAAVHHKVQHGTSAVVDSKENKGGAFDPAEEPTPTSLAGGDNDLWEFWINPSQTWGAAAPVNYRGTQNKLRFATEFDGPGDETVQLVDAEDPVGTYGDNILTATEIQRGEVTPTNVVARRVTDPVVGSRMAFEFILDRYETGWTQGTKFRVQGQARNSLVPFAEEMWAVCAVRYPTEMLLQNQLSAYWSMFGQFHNGSEDLITNPTLAFELLGGNGDAAHAELQCSVRRYFGDAGWPGSPVEQTDSDVANIVIARNLAASDWHYVVINYLIEPGYDSPNYPGQRIYGGAESLGDSPRGFIRVYYAAGETAEPVLVGEYRGWIGSPIVPGNAKEDDVIDWYGSRRNVNAPTPYMTLYSKTDFTFAPPGDVRRLWHLGWKGWMARHNPGMTASVALRRYRRGT